MSKHIFFLFSCSIMTKQFRMDPDACTSKSDVWLCLLFRWQPCVQIHSDTFFTAGSLNIFAESIITIALFWYFRELLWHREAIYRWWLYSIHLSNNRWIGRRSRPYVLRLLPRTFEPCYYYIYWKVNSGEENTKKVFMVPRPPIFYSAQPLLLYGGWHKNQHLFKVDKVVVTPWNMT